MDTQDAGSPKASCPLARHFVSPLAGAACPPHPGPSDVGAARKFLPCAACCMVIYFAYFNTCHQVLGSKALGSRSFSEVANGRQPAPYQPASSKSRCGAMSLIPYWDKRGELGRVAVLGHEIPGGWLSEGPASGISTLTDPWPQGLGSG